MMQQQGISRLAHIDMLRGLIIVFMVVDHAMAYRLGFRPSDPIAIPDTEATVFWTRFISHFCAPLFVFLAGMSASFTETRFVGATGMPSSADTREFSLGLIRRGFVLILFEFTIVSWAWTFNPVYPSIYAQVIWAIGWGFIFLGLLRLAGVRTVLIAGLLIVPLHNLLDGVSFADGSFMNYLWSVLHVRNTLALPFGYTLTTLYPILPIIGLMGLGYMAGRYYRGREFSRLAEQRALVVGLACLLTYGVLRAGNLYGDPHLFTAQESLHLTVMSFFNPTKYPLSLQFMLVTVGGGLVTLALLARLRTDFSASFLQLLGRTSLFSYIVHLYLLHAMAWLLVPVMGFSFSDANWVESSTGLPVGFGLSWGGAMTLAGVAVVLTTLLARLYLPWRQANRDHLIARYI